MRKIGIFKGIFDPISQRELKEALSWMKNEKLSFVVFEIENDATISISERKALVKKAIKPYCKLLLDYNFHQDDVILHKEASNIDEEEIRNGSFYLGARGIKKELLQKGYYFESAVKFHCNQKRYLHSLAVKDVCIDLASASHLDQYIANTMGILHDITKNKPDEWNKTILDIYDPKITSMSPKVWHSETAVFFLKKEMGLHDQRILNAIWHHTLGTGKSDYAKVLYIADKCEPTRGYDASKELNLTRKSLKQGFDLCIEESKAYRKKENA